jgi:putative ABC transport system permease protein
MSLLGIALRSIRQRGVASVLTIISMSLGVALIVAVLIVYGVIKDSFDNSANGYHLIIGKKGSRLELVLNTVYHQGKSNEPLPWSFYKDFMPEGKYGSVVEQAVPYCLGDNYQGYRVVATTPGLFDHFEFAPGRKYEFDAGRNFGEAAALAAGEKPPEKPVKKRPDKPTMVLDDSDDVPQPHHHHDHSAPPFFNEAVIGWQVHRKTGLKAGDSFQPEHGLTAEGVGEAHVHDPIKIVGVLKPTGTPNDKALFMNIEGFYLLDGHAKTEKGEEQVHEHHDGPLPEEKREVTAILVKFYPDTIADVQGLTRKINEGDAAMAVAPRSEITRLFDNIIGPVLTLLGVVAVVIVIVAGVGVVVSIYNSMIERRREIAVMRSLGAGRTTVLSIVLLESLLLSLAGGLLGFLIGHGLPALFGGMLLDFTGVDVGGLNFPTAEIRVFKGTLIFPVELVLLPGLVLLSALVGFFPALTAYRTDVSRALSASN